MPASSRRPPAAVDRPARLRGHVGASAPASGSAAGTSRAAADPPRASARHAPPAPSTRSVSAAPRRRRRHRRPESLRQRIRGRRITAGSHPPTPDGTAGACSRGRVVARRELRGLRHDLARRHRQERRTAAGTRQPGRFADQQRLGLARHRAADRMAIERAGRRHLAARP
jgi:hypothetical protein